MTINIHTSQGLNDIENYSDAIRFAGEILVKNKEVEPMYIKACIDRETLYPTGLLLNDGVGVAIPHGDSDQVLEDSLSIVRLTKPVDFGLMEDNEKKVPCSLIFNLALTSGKTHITILRQLMGLFQDEEFMTICLNGRIEEINKRVTKTLIT